MIEPKRVSKRGASKPTPNPGFAVGPGNPESTGNLESRLRECVKLVGSGDKLAQKTGIPRSTLETYLTGRAEPKLSRVVAIADAAGVSVDWLATGALPMLRRGDVAYTAPEQVASRQPGVAEAAGSTGLDNLDEGLLTAAVCAVDEYLQNRSLQLDSVRKAQLIGLLYDIVYDEEQADRDHALSKNVTRLFKLVS